MRSQQGVTENAGLDIDGPTKMQGWPWSDRMARVDIVGPVRQGWSGGQ